MVATKNNNVDAGEPRDTTWGGGSHPECIQYFLFMGNSRALFVSGGPVMGRGHEGASEAGRSTSRSGAAQHQK